MKKLTKNITIFAILGIFFSAYFGEILHIDARAGHSSSRSSSSSSRSGKGDGTGSVVVTAIAVLYYAIYEIRRRKLLKKAKKDLADALKDDSSWKLD